MRYGSVCSGIEAATVAWHTLGWKPAFFSEIEPFPSAVLKHHYPGVPNLGDMTKFKEWPDAVIDVLVGGTPCQSFSVAGLRKGLDDPRGNLMLTYLAIADRYRPRWLVWENVPGALSSNGGKDFGTFLGGLGELGYGFAYRVLDAQYFGVAQRRRRVFVVGCLGSWQRAAAVLFERHSLSGNPAPSREKRQGVAGNVARSLTRRYDSSEDGTGRGLELIPVVSIGIDEECNASFDHFGPLLRGGQGGTRQAVCMAHGQANAEVVTDGSPALTCNHEAPIVAAFPWKSALDPIGKPDNISPTLIKNQTMAVAYTQNQCGDVLTGDIAPSMGTNCSASGRNSPKVMTAMQVRRLIPEECESLQGFPRNYTQISWRKKPAEDCPDGPRYKALGNSMAVPCMRWIGKRIDAVAGVQA